MKTKFLSFALAVAFCAPAFAQKMGSTNSDAPMVKQTVEAGDAKISLDYTSITWADGRTMGRIMDKENGGRMRSRINETASASPLGSLNTSVDLMCGDLHLPAGKYTIFFTITDDLEWQINFMNGDKTHTMKLPLADSEHESKRLMMCLYAGEDEGAGVYVAFGKHSGTIDLKPHVAK